VKRAFRGARYANVTATLALVVALGGTSYAATQLPANSVGAKQIKKEAVTGSKIAKNAVTSKQVKGESLQASDFAKGQLPAGPEGKQGPEGPEGKQGPQGEKGTAKAYALVRVDEFTEFSPVFVGPHPGFVSVAISAESEKTANFCLAPEPGLVVEETAPLASIHFGLSSFVKAPSVGILTSGGCDPGELAVQTRDTDDSPWISFSVAIP
jgi:hypothetical protein